MHPFSLPRRALVLIVMCAALAAPIEATDASDVPTITAMDVGFGGVCKTGCWTPIRLTVAGGDAIWSGRVEIECVDGDGVRVVYEDDQLHRIAPGGETTVFSYAKIGRQRCSITARLASDGGVASLTEVLAGPRQAAPSTHRIHLVLGASIGVADALQRRRRDERERDIVVALDSWDTIPDRPLGYDSVAIVSLSTSQGLDDLSPRQRQAIVDWVRGGGTLLLAAARNAPEVFGESGDLRDFSPGLIREVVEQSDAASIESFAKARDPLAAFEMAMIEQPRGVRLDPGLRVRDALRKSRPFALRVPVGLGEVVYFAADLDLPPFSQWSGRRSIINAALRPAGIGGRMRSDDAEPGVVGQLGYADLAAQLHTAMDRFPDSEGRSRISSVYFSIIVVLIVIYGLAVSVGDYWLHRSISKRLLGTWITFPLTIGAACFGLYWLNHSWKGRQVLVSQWEVVDVDAATGSTRGSLHAHVFGAQGKLLDLELAPQSPAANNRLAQAILAWEAPPGRALGGLESTAPTMLDRSYRVRIGSPQAPGVSQAPLLTGGTLSLAGRWRGQCELGRAAFLYSEDDGRLAGEVVNPLNATLTDCYLHYRNEAYRIDRDLRPGEGVPVAGLRTRDLEMKLTRRQVAREEATYRLEPWTLDNDNVHRILELVTFFEAAGGESYSSLPSEHLADLDMSRLLHTGRAVLLGRLAEGGSRIRLADGTDLTELADSPITVCRVVLPVAPVGASENRENRDRR